MTTAVISASPSSAPIRPIAAPANPANVFQQGTGTPTVAAPGSTTRGLCSLSYAGQSFVFRTNPNSIWWTYELITKTEDTYGGRVVQILGTKLGDLTVRVECGSQYNSIGGQIGGWPYEMQVVSYLINLMKAQRAGPTATFEYTTRGYKMNVYSMSVPFQDDWQATTREIELQFKIQEDISGVVSGASLDAELAALQVGVYRPNMALHNQFNDPSAAGTPAVVGLNSSTLSALLNGSLANPNLEVGGYTPTSVVNPVDTQPGGGAQPNPEADAGLAAGLGGGLTGGIANLGGITSLLGAI
jgi:hypothetical protein